MQPGPLRTWASYASTVLVYFLALMALNWATYLIWDAWFDWWGVLALAAMLPALGLIITWD